MVVMRSVFVVFTIAVLCACQPADESPGLWLNGDVVAQPVDNWQFAAEIEEIFVETSPWYGIAHSTTIWSVVSEGKLFIGSYGEEKKTWENNLAQDSEARLGISDKLYEVVITPVTDKQLTADLDLAYIQKYDMAAVFGSETPVWWFYHVEQR